MPRMLRHLLPLMMLLAVIQPACKKNPQLGTVALDVYTWIMHTISAPGADPS
jgi:hypothetical protein